MSQQDAFDRILASLHEAALDDARWPATSGMIDEACGIKGNSLALGARHLDDSVQIFMARFFHRGQRREDWEREYYQVYHAHDERAPRLNRVPDGQIVHVKDLYTEQERKTSLVYNEVLPHADNQNSLNVHLDGPDGTHIVWVLADPVGRGGWEPAQTKMIEGLLPHVRQFVRVRQALANAHIIGASLAELVDSTDMGVICLDQRGRIVEMNDRAFELFRQGGGLRADGGGLRADGGRLLADLPRDNDRLQRLLARALPPCGGQPTGGSMTIARSFGWSRLTLHVNPVYAHPMSFGRQRVSALLLVGEPGGSQPRLDPRIVGAALGLTPLQSQIAIPLAQGREIGCIAQTLGRKESTVRWHIKRLLRSQGIHRQSDLVRLVLSTGRFQRV